MPGTLVEVEEAIMAVERASSQEAACANLRPGKELQGLLRWMRRRLGAVHLCLLLLKGLLPELFIGCEPTISVFSARLGLSPLLPALREIAASHLSSLPAPIGFSPRDLGGGSPINQNQHPVGTDPPTEHR